MHPSFPETADDLVPLPPCAGPKLRPFGFEKSKRIEIVEFLGLGIHSIVFKIKVDGEIYALKVFRFVFDENWVGPTPKTDDPQILAPFAYHSEPFYAECRAYGRLQEAGYEELSTRCYGYVLLDEQSERRIMEDVNVDPERAIIGDCYEQPPDDSLRTRFRDKNGRVPPLRGIVKEFGRTSDDLNTKEARKTLQDIIKFQQLGIINLDVDPRQLINGKHADFSVAITLPHFQTSPELNPNLSREERHMLVYHTFCHSIVDYWSFDLMIDEEINDFRKMKGGRKKVKVHALPTRQTRYNFRNKPPRNQFYTLVDPRRQERISRRRPPPKWYYNAEFEWEAEIFKRRSPMTVKTEYDYEFRDGYIFPKDKPGRAKEERRLKERLKKAKKQ